MKIIVFHYFCCFYIQWPSRASRRSKWITVCRYEEHDCEILAVHICMISYINIDFSRKYCTCRRPNTWHCDKWNYDFISTFITYDLTHFSPPFAWKRHQKWQINSIFEWVLMKKLNTIEPMTNQRNIPCKYRISMWHHSNANNGTFCIICHWIHTRNIECFVQMHIQSNEQNK